MTVQLTEKKTFTRSIVNEIEAFTIMSVQQDDFRKKIIVRVKEIPQNIVINLDNYDDAIGGLTREDIEALVKEKIENAATLQELSR